MEVSIDHPGDRPDGGALLDGQELAAREAALDETGDIGLVCVALPHQDGRGTLRRCPCLPRESVS